MVNFDRLGRQERPGIEPSTRGLLAFSAEPHRHWWGPLFNEI